jgi:uncharacterized protein GlcG (DUF336 family)
MAERSVTFDTFKQHTYVPNKLYSVLNLARAAILADLAAKILTAAPAHSAAAINEAIETAGEFRWTLEVALVDGAGHVLDGFDGDLAINLAATVASGHGVATFGDGDLAHPSADTEITLINGRGSIEVIYGTDGTDGDQWTAADKVVIIVGDVLVGTDQDKILGSAVVKDTITDTLVA